MRLLQTGVIIIIFVLSACSASKNIEKTDRVTLENVRAHIQFLADDKLEGRRTGTAGERLAMKYISEQFQIARLEPKGTEGFFQAFEVNDGKMMGNRTALSINGNKLEPGKDFFVFPFSPNVTIDAIPAIAVQEADMPWFIDLKDILEENKDNPHFDLPAYIKANTLKAKTRDASAILMYNSSEIDDKLVFETKDRSEALAIPAIYIKKESAKKFLADKEASINVRLITDITEKKRTGYNVIGMINNNAPTTVVLGAHFDHLGYGEDGNSMIRTGEKNIHNGADDNASGTAGLIELARLIGLSKITNQNFLFIAFSGEELGLYGSKYFVEHPTIDIASISYMINMDMIGRLNDSSKVLTVGGYGTSPEWSVVLNNIYKSLTNNGKNVSPLNIRIDSSGTGPSDHTSFYRKDIPVIFYFTGLHSDYHRPSDDYDKINYSGVNTIVHHALSLVESLKDKGKLAFLKTREAQTSTSARFTVSLGIMPDYTWSGTGVRADGVSEGKAAQKAGLKTGDIIIQLGDHVISSLENYMQALSKFKKGDKTRVKFKRGNDVMESQVEF
jgi:aminopeptidase YwaD